MKIIVILAFSLTACAQDSFFTKSRIAEVSLYSAAIAADGCSTQRALRMGDGELRAMSLHTRDVGKSKPGPCPQTERKGSE